MFPLIFGIISGALSAFSGLASGISQQNQMRQQAAQAEAQANLMRKQAQLDRAKGEAEARQVSAERSRLTREYRQMTARNLVRLGAGNVELSTGSALDVALGNANLYAHDMAENKYQTALKLWQGNEAANRSNYQAQVYDSQASWLKKTASSMTGPNLFSAALSGATGGLSAYSLAGGTFTNLLPISETTKQAADIGKSFHNMWDTWTNIY